MPENGQSDAFGRPFDLFISSFSCWSLRTVSRQTAHFVSCGPLTLQVAMSDQVESDCELNSTASDSIWFQLIAADPIGDCCAVAVGGDSIATQSIGVLSSSLVFLSSSSG